MLWSHLQWKEIRKGERKWQVQTEAWVATGHYAWELHDLQMVKVSLIFLMPFLGQAIDQPQHANPCCCMVHFASSPIPRMETLPWSPCWRKSLQNGTVCQTTLSNRFKLKKGCPRCFRDFPHEAILQWWMTKALTRKTTCRCTKTTHVSHTYFQNACAKGWLTEDTARIKEKVLGISLAAVFVDSLIDCRLVVRTWI